MAEHRVKDTAVNSNVAPAGVVKRAATAEFVLAAQLHQAREQIIELKKQMVSQEQIIAQLQAASAAFEVQTLTTENEKLRIQFGLKTGQRLEKNEDGMWSVIDASESEGR